MLLGNYMNSLSFTEEKDLVAKDKFLGPGKRNTSDIRQNMKPWKPRHFHIVTRVMILVQEMLQALLQYLFWLQSAGAQKLHPIVKLRSV